MGEYEATGAEAEQYLRDGWWRSESLAEIVQQTALAAPGANAFIGSDGSLTWAQYATAAAVVEQSAKARGLARGDRVAVLLPDSPVVHAVYLGLERAGYVTVGIGPRDGRQEVEHLVGASGARAFVSPTEHREHDFVLLAGSWIADGRLDHHFVVDGTNDQATIDGRPLGDPMSEKPASAGLRPDEVFLLNSTSGTTGLPKLVRQTMNRWYAFHKLAVSAGNLSPDDVFMSVIPTPFGFGLWTAHFTPTLLGAQCVVMERFTANGMIEAIERFGVTVLSAVSTQFVMMLNDPGLANHDMSSLRVLFTGGEAVPSERAARFEHETGAAVLQFFGSNETGALSATTLSDSPDRRHTTAGRVIPEMQVRLFDEDGLDVTASGGPGQPGCRGPVTCHGYHGGEGANNELVRPDGWMLMGDIVEIDDAGYLSVVGRKSDFIIRGGKNVSAQAVESALLGVPRVSLVGVVAAPSATFGERVCAYLVLEDEGSISLEEVRDNLRSRGISKETWPEFLVVVDELPISSGGKVAKVALRDDVAERVRAGEVST